MVGTSRPPSHVHLYGGRHAPPRRVSLVTYFKDLSVTTYHHLFQNKAKLSV